MSLLFAFACTFVIGALIATGLGWMVELYYKPASLLVFLVLFWGSIPLAWRVAVRFTEPSGATTS